MFSLVLGISSEVLAGSSPASLDVCAFKRV